MSSISDFSKKKRAISPFGRVISPFGRAISPIGHAVVSRSVFSKRGDTLWQSSRRCLDPENVGRAPVSLVPPAQQCGETYHAVYTPLLTMGMFLWQLLSDESCDAAVATAVASRIVAPVAQNERGIKPPGTGGDVRACGGKFV